MTIIVSCWQAWWLTSLFKVGLTWRSREILAGLFKRYAVSMLAGLSCSIVPCEHMLAEED